MDVQILLFSILKERAGQSRLTLTVKDGATVNDVRQALAERYPEMDVNVEHAIASVNRDFATDSDMIQEGDEVAFFPPVSGGSGESWPELFALPTEAINHDEVIHAITTPSTGAVALFSGIVRGKTQKEGHLPQTDYLEYEAYEPMAIEKMQQVAQEIRIQWPKVQGIAILQRLGRLSVGQNTVLIACSAAHRDDGCFEATRYGIDRLKEIVPVWKKEVNPDGEVWIEGEYKPTPADTKDAI
jgi:molybdopterin converting factor subunit 1